jgi:hypothetical protein
MNLRFRRLKFPTGTLAWARLTMLQDIKAALISTSQCQPEQYKNFHLKYMSKGIIHLERL